MKVSSVTLFCLFSITLGQQTWAQDEKSAQTLSPIRSAARDSVPYIFSAGGVIVGGQIISQYEGRLAAGHLLHFIEDNKIRLEAAGREPFGNAYERAKFMLDLKRIHGGLEPNDRLFRVKLDDFMKNYNPTDKNTVFTRDYYRAERGLGTSRFFNRASKLGGLGLALVSGYTLYKMLYPSAKGQEPGKDAIENAAPSSAKLSGGQR